MFKTFIPICTAAVLSAVFSCTNIQSKQAPASFVARSGTGIHVVELFTSEGCSSCPSADRLLSKLKEEGDSNVYVLSYHVDYWDYLGWKDPFSQAAFSNRQRQYAQRFSLESIYTPQEVINGEEEFTGSDEKRLRASLVKPSGASIALTASAAMVDKNAVQVSYSLSSPVGLVLNVALVQTEVKTEVKRGENGGRTLQHVNVVRELKTAEAQATGKVDLRLPDAVKAELLSLIVFVQQKGGGKITGATRVAIPSQKGA